MFVGRNMVSRGAEWRYRCLHLLTGDRSVLLAVCREERHRDCLGSVVQEGDRCGNGAGLWDVHLRQGRVSGVSFCLDCWRRLSPAPRSSARADDISGLEGLLSEAIVSSASKQAEGVSATRGYPPASALRTCDGTVHATWPKRSITWESPSALPRTSTGERSGARGVLLTGDRGSHFLILVDGYVYDDPLRGGSSLGFRAGVPLELIDHIEVIVGPGSCCGPMPCSVVNVVTKRAKDYPKALVVAESRQATTCVSVSEPAYGSRSWVSPARSRRSSSTGTDGARLVLRCGEHRGRSLYRTTRPIRVAAAPPGSGVAAPPTLSIARARRVYFASLSETPSFT